MKVTAKVSVGDKWYTKETHLSELTEIEQERVVKVLFRAMYATVMIDLNIGAYKKEDGEPLL